MVADHCWIEVLEGVSYCLYVFDLIGCDKDIERLCRVFRNTFGLCLVEYFIITGHLEAIQR